MDKFAREYIKFGNRGALKKLIKESEKMAKFIAKNKGINNLLAEEAVDRCRASVLNKALKSFNQKTGIKFQTYLYWKFLGEIHKVIEKNNRQKRIPQNRLVYLDRFNDYSLPEKEVDRISGGFYSVRKKLEFKDLIENLNSKLPKKYRELVELFLMGYSRNQSFNKLGIRGYKTRNNMLKKLKEKTEEVFNVH